MHHPNKIIIPLLFLSVVNLHAMKVSKETSSSSSSPTAAKLFFAIQRNDFKEIQEALMEDRDCVNARDNLGNTPLIIATIKEDPIIVQILLANNANPSFTTPFGQKAHDIAGKLHLLKFYLAKEKRQRRSIIAAKKEQTRDDLQDISRLLAEIGQLLASLNNLELIIDQLNKFSKYFESPSDQPYPESLYG